MTPKELRVGLRVRYVVYPAWGGKITSICNRGRAVVKWTKVEGRHAGRPPRVLKAKFLTTTIVDQLAALARDPS